MVSLMCHLPWLEFNLIDFSLILMKLALCSNPFIGSVIVPVPLLTDTVNYWLQVCPDVGVTHAREYTIRIGVNAYYLKLSAGFEYVFIQSLF